MMSMFSRIRINGKKHFNKRKWFGLVFLLLVLVSGSCNQASNDHKNKRPNLLIVMADQWRGSALGFLGEEPVKTPNIDHFAEQSLVLTDVIANAPVCTPSRAMLMSGQYPQTSGVWGNGNTRGYEMKTSTKTWSDVLNDQGYSLGYIGKWHLDIPRKPYVDVYNNRGPVKWDAWTPPRRRHGFKFWYAYGTYDQHMKPMYWTTYVPKNDWFYVDEWEPTHDADVAIKFIENEDGIYRNPDKPFGLVVSMNPPHMPYSAVPKKYQKRYENIPIDSLVQRPNIPPEGSKWGDYYRKNIRNYYAMMTGVDKQFGRILNVLEEDGLKDNTIVLFTSDHGNQLGIHNNISKSTPQEESVQVPFIIRYPGTIKPRQDSLLLSTPDIYPTLLDLMGLEDKTPGQVEGNSYAQNFKSGTGERPGFQLYIEPGHPEFGMRGLRTNRYTFVMDNEKDATLNILLFDNNQDPYQMNNIFKERPKLAKQFKKQLKQTLKKHNDPWLKHLNN